MREDGSLTTNKNVYQQLHGMDPVHYSKAAPAEAFDTWDTLLSFQHSIIHVPPFFAKLGHDADHGLYSSLRPLWSPLSLLSSPLDLSSLAEGPLPKRLKLYNLVLLGR